MLFKKRIKRAILYFVWGEKYVNDAIFSINHSILPDYPIFIITDKKSDYPCKRDVNWLLAEFPLKGLVRKASLKKLLPEGFNSFLFVDSDIQVLQDISLGFPKAELHGLAIAPAPHYSLDYFWNFSKVMEAEGVPLKSQLQYNTGFFFFEKTKISKLFNLWESLSSKYAHIMNNDQPFLTLAMEKLGFIPYVLSPAYNYRPFLQPISGVVKVWHSNQDIPAGINEFDKSWPPRYVKNGLVIGYDDLG